jgi:hypothetical protein
MDWRLISAFVPVGASFGLIALSACAATAADVTKPKRDIASHAWRSRVSEPIAAERGRPRFATRRGVGEEHGLPRMALVLGVAF